MALYTDTTDQNTPSSTSQDQTQQRRAHPVTPDLPCIFIPRHCLPHLDVQPRTAGSRLAAASQPPEQCFSQATPRTPSATQLCMCCWCCAPPGSTTCLQSHVGSPGALARSSTSSWPHPSGPSCIEQPCCSGGQPSADATRICFHLPRIMLLPCHFCIQHDHEVPCQACGES